MHPSKRLGLRRSRTIWIAGVLSTTGALVSACGEPAATGDGSVTRDERAATDARDESSSVDEGLVADASEAGARDDAPALDEGAPSDAPDAAETLDEGGPAPTDAGDADSAAPSLDVLDGATPPVDVPDVLDVLDATDALDAREAAAPDAGTAGASAVVELSVRGAMACALRADGRVDCWGEGPFANLGLGARTNIAAPTELPGITDAVDLALGDGSLCVVRRVGSVHCRGASSAGQLGNGMRGAVVPAGSTVIGLGDAEEIATAGLSYCVRGATGVVQCWGASDDGQLAGGSALPATTPVTARSVENARSLAGGVGNYCAIDNTGRVICWGSSPSRQFGASVIGSVGTTWPAIADPLQVVVSQHVVCVRNAAGEVYCAGLNSSGQLGRAAVSPREMTPGLVVGVSDARALFIDEASSQVCARLADDTVKCWGSTQNSPFADDGVRYQSERPRTVLGLRGVRAMAFNQYGGLVYDGASLRAWGHATFRGISDGSTSVRTPTLTERLTSAREVVTGSGGASGFALMADTTVLGWGSWTAVNQASETFPAGAVARPIPGPVLTGRDAPLRGVLELRGSPTHTCARTGDGAVHCWGTNSSFETGQPLSPALDVAARVPAIADAEQIAVGAQHTCVRRRTGTVLCFGRNHVGQLGVPVATRAESQTPVLAGSLDAVTDVSAGDNFTCAVQGGRVFCWGDNSANQLGMTGTARRETPTMITAAGLTDVVEVRAANRTACARVASGALYCWGDSQYGQTGSGTTRTIDPTPAAVSGIDDANALWMGPAGTNCARRTDGSLWCWGQNTDGQLGDPAFLTGTSRVPRRVTGLAGPVRSVAMLATAMCAALDDGRVQCWGLNDASAALLPVFSMVTLP